MARKRGTRITVLVEDELLDRFARRTLENLGYHPREIRVVPGYPRAGHGSAKNWVDNRYPQEAKTCRQKSDSQRVALLIGTEADQMTVAERSELLAAALSNARMEPRKRDEPIAHWIPRWSIETWGLALTGQSVNEETRYKNTAQAKGIDWKAVAGAFVEDYGKPPADRVASLPSILAAYRETDRFK